MKASHVLDLINERDRYKTECAILRACCASLTLACMAVIVIAQPWALAVFAVAGLMALFVAGLMFAAKRGDASMGIGDTQGRDFPADHTHSTPSSEAHSEGPADLLRKV